MERAVKSVKHFFTATPHAHVKLFEDEVHTYEMWDNHRSSWRHRPEPNICLRVASGFTWPLAYVFVLSIAVGVYDTLLSTHPGWPAPSQLKLSQAVSIIAFAIPLLLVFRTNSCYSRWWEGRIIWGLVVNNTRNLARQALTQLPREDAHITSQILKWVCVSPLLLKAHIRQGGNLREDLKGVVTAAEMEWILSSSNAPVCVCLLLSQLVASAHVHPVVVRTMEEQVTGFQNAAGGCERILKTAIPVAYTRHASRLLMVYVTSLPLLLWSSLGWATPATATLTAFLLLGIENIGVQIEEPFHVLPLDAICRAILQNVQEMADRHDSAIKLLESSAQAAALYPPGTQEMPD